MSVAQFMLELQWKQGLSLDLNTIEAWMKANAGSQYCGNQAGATLQLWFLSEPLQSVKDAINAYWAALDALPIQSLIPLCRKHQRLPFQTLRHFYWHLFNGRL